MSEGTTPPVVETAPTPVAPPASISASMDAANRGDFSAFEKAEGAKRSGTPLSAVPVAADPPPPPTTPEAPTAPPVLTKEQKADARLRQRVAEAVSPLEAEIARLRAQLATPAHRDDPPPAPSSTDTPVAEWKRLAALPHAPKLADFESVEEHTAAMSLFIANTVHAEREAAARDTTKRAELTAAQQARVEGFVKQLQVTKAADPEFVGKLTPEVKALKPFGALIPGEASGPRNVLAEQIYDSPIAPTVLLHLSQHPEALRRFDVDQMPPAIAAVRDPDARAHAHMQWIVREYGKLEASLEDPAVSAPAPAAPSPISAAPPPAPTLSRAGGTADPKAAALARDDFAAFDRLEMQASIAKRRPA